VILASHQTVCDGFHNAAATVPAAVARYRSKVRLLTTSCSL